MGRHVNPTPEKDPAKVTTAVDQSNETRRGLTRRETFRTGALVVGTVAVAGVAVGAARASGVTGDPVGQGTRRLLPVMVNIPAQPHEDVLLRMQRDLVKAMKKPVEQRITVMERPWRTSTRTGSTTFC